MDVQAIAAKITTLLEEVHADGVKKGRDLENQDAIQSMIEALEKRRDQPKPQRRKRAATTNGPTNGPTPPDPAPEDFVTGRRTRVEEGLAYLALGNTEGVFPDLIADHTGLKVREVRAALRHLTLTGTVRRMARGKYLPATPMLNLASAAQ